MFDGVDTCLTNGHNLVFCNTVCKDVKINQVAQGVSLDLLKCLPSNSVDTIVTTRFLSDTSIPADIQQWNEELHRVLRKGGLIFAFAQNENYPAMAIDLERSGFTPRDVISWLQWSVDPDAYHLKPTHIPIFMGLKKGNGKRLKDLGIVFNIDDVRIPYRDAKDKAIAQYGADGFAKRLKQPEEKYLAKGWGMRRIHDYQVNTTGRYPTNVASEKMGDPYIQGKFTNIQLENSMIHEPKYTTKEAEAGAKRRIKSQNKRGAKGTFLKGMNTMTQEVHVKGVHPRNVVTVSDLDSIIESQFVNEPNTNSGIRRIKERNSHFWNHLPRKFDPSEVGKYPRNVVTSLDLNSLESQFVHEPKEKHSQHHKRKYTRKTNSTFFKDGMEDSHQAHPLGRFPANTVTAHDLLALEKRFVNEPTDIPETQVSHQSGFPQDRGKKIATRPFVPNQDGRYPQNVVTNADLKDVAPKNKPSVTQYDSRQIAEWILKLATHKGNVILDPMMEGTKITDTARKMGRHFIGFVEV